jgi:hypothetical protein
MLWRLFNVCKSFRKTPRLTGFQVKQPSFLSITFHFIANELTKEGLRNATKVL